jgi:hypothetical protein
MEEYNEFYGSNGFFFIIFVAVVLIAAIWRVFQKAGKPGWAAIIPFYNILILLEIIGKPWWWLLIILFIPFANIIFGIWSVNLLSKSFGQGVGFTLGLIFLGFIFYPILGFGNFEYQGPAGK